MLYPLVLSPVCKDYLWGGKNLINIYPCCDMESIAESWVLSCHEQGVVTVLNGEYAGLGFFEYLQKQTQPVIGAGLENKLPVLIKLIDTSDNLSIQVHPDDAHAKAQSGESGKTEFWYIMDCEKDAFIYYGFQRNISENLLVRSSKNGTVLDLLEKIKVKNGDVFLIKPGMVHAIGKGMTVAEIGTNCNITYRIYDFFRKDRNGNSRELHIEQAAEVALLEKYERTEPVESETIDCGEFKIQKLCINKAQKLSVSDQSFHSLLCISGEGFLKSDFGSLKVSLGTSIFIPAGFGEYIVDGNAKLLKTTV